MFIVGGGVGMWLYSSLHHCPEIQSNARTITTVSHKTDTTLTYSNIFATSNARTKYIGQHVSPLPESLTGRDSVQSVIENISYWDTTASDGFNAHIEYWHKKDVFVNRFRYPVREIRDDVIVNTLTEHNNIITKIELPEWEIGIGGNIRYKDSKINYSFFPLFNYNHKILFMSICIEARGNVVVNAGSVSLEPEMAVRVKIGL